MFVYVVFALLDNTAILVGAVAAVAVVIVVIAVIITWRVTSASSAAAAATASSLKTPPPPPPGMLRPNPYSRFNRAPYFDANNQIYGRSRYPFYY